MADFAQFFLQNVSFIYVMKPQNLSGVVWRRFTPLKQPRKLTLGVRFLLVDGGIVDAMAWCGLEKFVRRVFTYKEAFYELIHDSV